jgi:uncharacterized protein
MTLEPAIYTGTLRHRRSQPRRHEFVYSLFMAFLDIDRISETMRRSRFSSYNRFNWASFDERDHFGPPELPLRERLRRDARAQGVEFPDGPVFLLTHLRYLGYCFNPISLYFCYGKEGSVQVVLAEVNSTFGESRNYWLGAHNALPGQNSLRFACPKSLHVSPFMKMALDYEFVITEPADRLVVHMNTFDHGKMFFDATLALERRAWTSAHLASALLRQPFMTGKVIGAIHWQALRLYLKKIPVVRHPGVSSR